MKIIESIGELKRIKTKVDWDLEMGTITSRSEQHKYLIPFSLARPASLSRGTTHGYSDHP